MKYTINVTREYIYRGKPGCPATCPVALAIFEQTGITANISGDVAFLTIPPGTEGHPLGSRRDVFLPPEVLNFVRQFDFPFPTGSYSEPFSFILDTEVSAENEGWTVN